MATKTSGEKLATLRAQVRRRRRAVFGVSLVANILSVTLITSRAVQERLFSRRRHAGQTGSELSRCVHDAAASSWGLHPAGGEVRHAKTGQGLACASRWNSESIKPSRLSTRKMAHHWSRRAKVFCAVAYDRIAAIQE